MSTFHIPDTTPSVPVHLTDDLSKDQLLSFPAFKTWISTLQRSLKLQSKSNHPFHKSPFALRSITIQACDFFGGSHLGFIKLKAEVSNGNGETLPGSVFLRGGSVAMLLILQPDDAQSEREEYVILTVQPRIPAGSLAFVELPAGMLDDSGTFSGGAAKEIKEETGLEIEEKDLVDMTNLASQSSSTDAQGEAAGEDEEGLQKAVYPSPGGCDEFIPLFLARMRMSRFEIEGMKGRLTGLRSEGEKITLRICRLDEVWRVGGKDGKTLAAVAVYEGLKREGRL